MQLTLLFIAILICEYYVSMQLNKNIHEIINDEESSIFSCPNACLNFNHLLNHPFQIITSNIIDIPVM